MRRIFINCHVPKTAGTSLIDGFYQLFGQDNCMVQASIEDASFPETVKNSANVKTFFSGHITLPRLLSVKRELLKHGIDAQIVSSIRETVNHFLSAFLHSQKFGGLGSVEESVTLEEFLASPGAYPSLNMIATNSVTKYYSGDQENFQADTSLVAAVENAKEIDFIFNADRLEESFALFADKYEFLKRPKIPRLNENIQKSQRYFLENYHLMPTMTDVNRHDCALYSDLGLRWIGMATKTYTGPARQLETKGKSLSEAVRRSHYKITAETEGLVQFVNNDMLLHPPENDVSEIEGKAVFEASGYFKFSSRITLDEKSLHPVMLSIEVFFGNEYSCHIKQVRPGEDSTISFEMTNVFGAGDIRMSSYLLEKGKRPDFANLKLLDPRFTLEM